MRKEHYIKNQVFFLGKIMSEIPFLKNQLGEFGVKGTLLIKKRGGWEKKIISINSPLFYN